MIENTYDFECAQMAMPYVSKVCDAFKNVQKIIDGMISFVEPLTEITRKEAALKIISAYGKTNRASYVFNLLDGKELDKDSYKKLLLQSLGESE